MKTIQICSIKDMLDTHAIDGNQSKLSLLLKINRHTLRKYMKDNDCGRHMIAVINGKYRFASLKGEI